MTIDGEIGTYVNARAHDFHDNDPEQTKRTIQHLWVNSGLEREEFFGVLEEAFRRTKDMLQSGSLQRDERGRQKGWPLCLKLIRDLVEIRKIGSRTS